MRRTSEGCIQSPLRLYAEHPRVGSVYSPGSTYSQISDGMYRDYGWGGSVVFSSSNSASL